MLGNVLVLVFFQKLGTNVEVIAAYSVVPVEILSGTNIVLDGVLAPFPQPGFFTLLTSM